MCIAVYIGTDKKLKLEKYVQGITEIYFEKLTDEEEKYLRPKFSKKNIYYVGSYSCCSCGFLFDSKDFNDPDEQDNKKSAHRLLDVLNKMSVNEYIEFYCCWEGDWNLPIESSKEIDIREVSLDKNYYGPNQNEFIVFKHQFEP